VTHIREELKNLNEAAKARYDLTVSVGIAKTDIHEALPFEEFAARADEKLYEEKERLKKGEDK
jgi:GGDEF domain-containing protein